jgi:hypothetical protein
MSSPLPPRAAGRPVTPDRRSQTTRVPRGMIGTATRVPCPWPATPAAPIRGSPPRLPAAPPDAGDRRAGRGGCRRTAPGWQARHDRGGARAHHGCGGAGHAPAVRRRLLPGAAAAGGGGRAWRDRGAAPARRAPPAGRRRTQPRRWDSSWCTARSARRKGAWAAARRSRGRWSLHGAQPPSGLLPAQGLDEFDSRIWRSGGRRTAPTTPTAGCPGPSTRRRRPRP